MLCLEESTFGAGTGNGSVFFDRAENGYPENTVILETRHIRRNFKFLKQQLEPNIIVDYLVQHNILNTDENSFLMGKPRATKCDFILCKLLQNPKHLRELKSIIKCNPQEEGFYCFLSLPWPNSEVRARRNPATVEKVLHSPSLGIVLDRNKDELLKEIILRISNESDSIVDDFLEEDVLSVDDHKEISAEIKKSKAANLLLENISSKLPESFLKLISILKGHKLNDLGDRLLREIDSDVLDLERTENKEQLKVEFVGGDMHCSMMASKIEIRKIKMIITSDDGNERVFEKVIEEISNSEEMIAQGTHSTFNKASLGSIVIVLQTESTFAMTKLKHFLEREGISTFLTQLFGSKEVWMLLKKDKYSIEVQIREAKDPAEYTPDIMQSIEPSRNTYKSRLERCHKFLLEELEPRCLLKEREVADIFHPVLEKINRAGLRSTKVKAFLEYLTNQSEEKIKVVVEKLKEKNKYIYNQLFPDTAKYQDIDINQVKGNILDNLPELLDIVRIRAIQTPLLSTGIITPEELEFIHKSSKSCRIETLQFLKLVLHRGDEAIKIFLSGMETSYGESTVQNLLERNDNLTTNDNDRGHANIDLKAFNEDDCLLFKGRFVLDFKTYGTFKEAIQCIYI
ncbi:uncharacterized protein LOC134279403 [Saccostrea cucullata]|uniref:uncharacterized protein LOC134279403 n=1 Tax=Saccostrea cuccullata TaxID=36930 RepID=UPI002ED64DBE